jgi:molybdopterin-biosynthesis enzyme MoeA-like protein
MRHPALVDMLERHYGTAMDEAYLKMTEVPDGAELITSDSVRFPTIQMRNVYILPGVPEIFRRKFEAIRERFRDRPFHLRNVFVRLGEGTIAAHMNALVREFPELAVGSYPELSNPEYRVKVTLESRDRECVEQALAAFVERLPDDAVVRVGETD